MSKKAWFSLFGGITTGAMGIFGLTLCCVPVAAGFSGLLGLISVFAYEYNTYLASAGIGLLLLSILLFIRGRNKCK